MQSIKRVPSLVNQILSIVISRHESSLLVTVIWTLRGNICWRLWILVAHLRSFLFIQVNLHRSYIVVVVSNSMHCIICRTRRLSTFFTLSMIFTVHSRLLSYPKYQVPWYLLFLWLNFEKIKNWLEIVYEN